MEPAGNGNPHEAPRNDTSQEMKYSVGHAGLNAFELMLCANRYSNPLTYPPSTGIEQPLM